jgi:hypothetical protein
LPRYDDGGKAPPRVSGLESGHAYPADVQPAGDPVFQLVKRGPRHVGEGHHGKQATVAIAVSPSPAMATATAMP